MVFSTKNSTAHYEIATYGNTNNGNVWSSGSGSIAELVGQCSNNSNYSAPIIPITEPGKYYWILYRIDNIPGVEINDECNQSGLCWKMINDIAVSATIQNEWFDYVSMNSPAPTNDYYVSMFRVTP